MFIYLTASFSRTENGYVVQLIYVGQTFVKIIANKVSFLFSKKTLYPGRVLHLF